MAFYLFILFQDCAALLQVRRQYVWSAFLPLACQCRKYGSPYECVRQTIYVTHIMFHSPDPEMSLCQLVLRTCVIDVFEASQSVQKGKACYANSGVVSPPLLIIIVFPSDARLARKYA